MTHRDKRGYGIASLAVMVGALSIGTYFAFAAVQGEYGVFRQVQIAEDTRRLIATRDRLAGELATLENLTRRLSDAYLDIDLLDERARDVLGYMRADEIVLR